MTTMYFYAGETVKSLCLVKCAAPEVHEKFHKRDEALIISLTMKNEIIENLKEDPSKMFNDKLGDLIRRKKDEVIQKFRQKYQHDRPKLWR